MDVRTFDELREYFDAREHASAGRGFVWAKWSGNLAREGELEDLGVTVRCLPLEQSFEEGSCILTGMPARCDAIFARAY